MIIFWDFPSPLFLEFLFFSHVGSCDQCAFVHSISVLSTVPLPIIAWYPTIQIILYFTLLRKTNLFGEMRLPSDVELQRASAYLNLQPIPILVSTLSPPTSTGTWSHQFWSLLGILCCKLDCFAFPIVDSGFSFLGSTVLFTSSSAFQLLTFCCCCRSFVFYPFGFIP